MGMGLVPMCILEVFLQVDSEEADEVLLKYLQLTNLVVEFRGRTEKLVIK